MLQLRVIGIGAGSSSAAAAAAAAGSAAKQPKDALDKQMGDMVALLVKCLGPFIAAFEKEDDNVIFKAVKAVALLLLPESAERMKDLIGAFEHVT